MCIDVGVDVCACGWASEHLLFASVEFPVKSLYIFSSSRCFNE